MNVVLKDAYDLDKYLLHRSWVVSWSNIHTIPFIVIMHSDSTRSVITFSHTNDHFFAIYSISNFVLSQLNHNLDYEFQKKFARYLRSKSGNDF